MAWSSAVSSDCAAQIIIPSDMPISAEITIPGMPKELIPVVVDAVLERLQTAQFRQDMTVLNSIVHIPTRPNFLSGGINRRTDEYGGSFENRGISINSDS